MLLGVEHDRRETTAIDTVNILLKYQTDIAKAVKELSDEQTGSTSQACRAAASRRAEPPTRATSTDAAPPAPADDSRRHRPCSSC